MSRKQEFCSKTWSPENLRGNLLLEALLQGRTLGILIGLLAEN